MSRPPPTAAVGGACKNFTLPAPPSPPARQVALPPDAFRGESFSSLGTGTGQGAKWPPLRAAAQRSADHAIGSLLPKGAGRAESPCGSAKKAPPSGGWEGCLPKKPCSLTSLSPSSRALPHRRIPDWWVTPGSRSATAVKESKEREEFLSSHCYLLFNPHPSPPHTHTAVSQSVRAVGKL